MGNDILNKLKLAQKKAIKKTYSKINTQTPLSTLTDEEIAMVLAMRAKNVRVSQEKTQGEFSKEAKLSSSSTYSNFEQKGTISLLNFIKVIRSFGRLHEFEELLKPTVKDKIDGLNKKSKKRIRHKLEGGTQKEGKL